MTRTTFAKLTAYATSHGSSSATHITTARGNNLVQTNIFRRSLNYSTLWNTSSERQSFQSKFQSENEISLLMSSRNDSVLNFSIFHSCNRDVQENKKRGCIRAEDFFPPEYLRWCQNDRVQCCRNDLCNEERQQEVAQNKSDNGMRSHYLFERQIRRFVK